LALVPVRIRAPRFARRAVRHSEFGDLQEIFLVSAIATILVIRTQLWATNYPQLGGSGLHIAHLLWGGVFMVLVIGALLTYLGRSMRQPAAIVGGVGFGFFIDELGKFITSDNNYFFEPTAALIYLIFVGLFLLSRWMQRRRGLTSREYVSNALDLVGEAARHDFDVREKRKALELLDRADQDDPMVPAVRELIHRVDTIPAPEPSWVTRRARAARDWYFRLIERPRFRRWIGLIFGVWALLSILAVLALVLSIGLDIEGAREGSASDEVGDLSVMNIASLVSSFGAAVLVLNGLIRLRGDDRLGAYRMFDRALLVQIFVTDVFSFIESQFSAVFGVSVNILLLLTLRYMISRERQLQRAALGPAAGGPAPAAKESPQPAAGRV
jgi:hypothetical protein